jgi:hypothetical protein
MIMRRLTLIAAVVMLGSLASTAQAQYKAKSRPFDSAGGRRPAVSPYMNLINNNTGVATNYQSLVRPQLEQQNFNAKSASAIKGLQRQAASSTRSASSHEGNMKMRGTGHTAARENYSHYYPQLGGR